MEFFFFRSKLNWQNIYFKRSLHDVIKQRHEKINA